MTNETPCGNWFRSQNEFTLDDLEGYAAVEGLQAMLRRCHAAYGKGETFEEYVAAYARFMSRDTDGRPDGWSDDTPTGHPANTRPRPS